jgi:hypothetical protein
MYDYYGFEPPEPRDYEQEEDEWDRYCDECTHAQMEAEKL